MLSKSMEKILNEQVQKEFYSAYFYLSMEAYFASENLNGFANFFRVQAQEERDHAMLIFNFINEAGGKVTLGQIDAPRSDFKSPKEVFELTLQHEQFVTGSIYEIVNLAIKEKDHKTNAFMQWFVTEQVEEEANMENNLKKLKFVGDNGPALLMMDAELAARVYAPPSIMQKG